MFYFVCTFFVCTLKSCRVVEQDVVLRMTLTVRLTETSAASGVDERCQSIAAREGYKQQRREVTGTNT